MPDIAYAEKLEEFRAQLRSKEEERDAQIARYNREIEALEKIVETLTGLFENTSEQNPVSARELDDLILRIFKEDPTAKFSRRRLLKKLLESGANLSAFSNRMSYIHASVARLHKKEILDREWQSIAGSIRKKLVYFLKNKED
jgi:hypothetical protein